MSFAFIENGSITQYPIGSVEIKRRFPNTSFPRNLETLDLTPFGAVTVHNVTQPLIDYRTERLEEGTPVFDGSQWNQVWNTVTLSAEEQQNIVDSRASSVREQRNELLSKSDWTQISDSSLTEAEKTAWQTYRQALRDLPSADGFPFDVTFPTKPGA